MLFDFTVVESNIIAFDYDYPIILDKKYSIAFVIGVSQCTV